jgi:hypothetical protein
MDDEIEVTIRRVLEHIYRRELKIPIHAALSHEQESRLENDAKVIKTITDRAREIGYSDSLQDAHAEPPQAEAWVMDSED